MTRLGRPQQHQRSTSVGKEATYTPKATTAKLTPGAIMLSYGTPSALTTWPSRMLLSLPPQSTAEKYLHGCFRRSRLQPKVFLMVCLLWASPHFRTSQPNASPTSRPAQWRLLKRRTWVGLVLPIQICLSNLRQPFKALI